MKKATPSTSESCISPAIIEQLMSDGRFLTDFPLALELSRAFDRHLAVPKKTATERAQLRKSALQHTKAIRTAASKLASELRLALAPDGGDSIRYIKAFVEGQEADWTAFERVLSLLRKVPAGELPGKYLVQLISPSDDGRHSLNAYALGYEFGRHEGGRPRDDTYDRFYRVLAGIYERGTGKKPACRKSGYEGKTSTASKRCYSGPFFRFVKIVLTVTEIRISDEALGRRLESEVIPAHRSSLARKERIRNMPP